MPCLFDSTLHRSVVTREQVVVRACCWWLLRSSNVMISAPLNILEKFTLGRTQEMGRGGAKPSTQGEEEGSCFLE